MVPRKMVKFSNVIITPEGYTTVQGKKIMKGEMVANPSIFM